LNELVYVKKNDVFIDSLTIAEKTENEHESIKRLITTHKSRFLTLGNLPISNREIIGAGRPEQYYELNEQQATFLITLLRNNEKVLNFKLSLVQEFYRMRQILIQRQTTEWLQTRKQGKLVRRDETDTIQEFIVYAEKQGSKNANKYYITFTKLVNKAVGLQSGQREQASWKTLAFVSMLEDIICKTVAEEMRNSTYYKEVYQICKRKVGQFAEITYLSA